MNQKNLVAVDVFDQGKQPTTPSTDTQNQTQSPAPDTTNNTQSKSTTQDKVQTAQDTNNPVDGKSNDLPLYIVGIGVLVVVLLLLVIIRKIYKK